MYKTCNVSGETQNIQLENTVTAATITSN